MSRMGDVPIRTAATTILVRENDRLEVLMVKRNQQIDFFSGAMLFPGGKVDPQDHDPEWAEYVRGWNDLEETERGPRIAALREAFEECGVIATTTGFSIDTAEAAEARKAIDSGALSFIDFVRTKKISLDLSGLTLFSRWLTPAIVSKRFDTYFYILRMPTGQTASHDGRETVENEWVAPGEALRLAAKGERVILFPTRMNLRLLAGSPSFEQAVLDARSRSRHQVLPSIVVRNGQRFIQLAEADGYGRIEELLQVG